jgi:hypothetical protein
MKKKLEWDECLCKCYIWLLFSKWIWKSLSERNVYVNVTYECCSQSEFEKTWVRGMFMQMLHMNVVLKVNMKKLEWEECLCKCYIWMLFSKWIWKSLSERNVYVNVAIYENIEW